jgi:hypothetical protein
MLGGGHRMNDCVGVATTLINAVINHLVLCYSEDEEWMVEAPQKAVKHIQYGYEEQTRNLAREPGEGAGSK